MPNYTSHPPMDVNVLNAKLRTQAQGTTLKINRATITSTMAGSLFVATEIPINVDLEFEDVIFEGDHLFRQVKFGRLVFKDCQIRGQRFEFTGCKRGFITFIGKIDIAFGLSFDQCEEVSLSLSGTNSTFEIHPEFHLPREYAERAARSLSVTIRRSSGIFLVKSLKTPLVFQVWESDLNSVEIEAEEIRLFQLMKTQLDRLILDWKRIDRLDCKSGDLSSLEVDFSKLMIIPLHDGNMPLSKGIDSKTLEVLAHTYKRNGYPGKFVKLFSRAGMARAFTRSQDIKKSWNKAKKEGQLSLKTRVILSFSLLETKLADLIVNRWFGRFYAPAPVLLTQLFTVFGFSIIYLIWNEFVIVSQSSSPIQSLREALYFSSVTFLTIGYGDILPIGSLQIVAMLEGFSGLILGLVLAIVASRRYGS